MFKIIIYSLLVCCCHVMALSNTKRNCLHIMSHKFIAWIELNWNIETYQKCVCACVCVCGGWNLQNAIGMKVMREWLFCMKSEWFQGRTWNHSSTQHHPAKTFQSPQLICFMWKNMMEYYVHYFPISSVTCIYTTRFPRWMHRETIIII